MPTKTKTPPKTKIEIVKKYLRGDIGARAAARQAGVCKRTLREWATRYTGEGGRTFSQTGHNRVYPPALKQAAVQEYLSGGLSQYEICQKYGISATERLRAWIRIYNAHGNFNIRKFSGGGSYMKQVRETTLEERVRIAKECLESDKNYGAMALKYNVSYQQVRSWTLRYLEMGEAGLEDRRGHRKKDQKPRTELEKAQIKIAQLEHDLYVAQMENKLLKKLKELERRDAYLK